MYIEKFDVTRSTSDVIQFFSRLPIEKLINVWLSKSVPKSMWVARQSFRCPSDCKPLCEVHVAALTPQASSESDTLIANEKSAVIFGLWSHSKFMNVSFSSAGLLRRCK